MCTSFFLQSSGIAILRAKLRAAYKINVRIFLLFLKEI